MRQALCHCLLILWILAPRPSGAADDFWPSTGRLERADGSGGCSGTLVAADLVVTAAHCAGLGAINGDDTPDLFFRPSSPKRATRLAAVRAVHHPLHAPGRESRSWRYGFDLALLRLARPLPDRLHPALSVGAPPRAGETIRLVSWRGTWPLARARDCTILEGPPNVTLVDCPVRSGESGGALLRAQSGGYEVVGVLTSQIRSQAVDIGQATHLEGRLSPMIRALERLEAGG